MRCPPGAIWEEALNYSSVDCTFDRIAFIERELAALKDRMRQLEASRHEQRHKSLLWHMARCR